MLALIRRVLTVLIGMIALMACLQWALTKDADLRPNLALHVTQTDPNGRRTQWQFTVGPYWSLRIGGSPATVGDVVKRVASEAGELSLTATDAKGATWTASRDAQGRLILAGRPASMEDLERKLLTASTPGADFTATRPVTIQEVLQANLPMPTRSKVSFPGFTYRQAFPEANDSPEIVVTTFDEAPMLQYLRDPNGVPPGSFPEDLKNWEEWRRYYGGSLPPVDQRLPRNPAVVVGPDGIGQYGGIWRRCTSGFTDLYRKLGYESFTRHDPSGGIQPGLAYKWEIGPDNRTFTFYLRKGHRWSDGKPFTSQDILWVCNKQIGSAHWSDPPDWMQPTDGSMLLYQDDVSDWPALARRIVQQAQAPDPSVGKQIRSLGDEVLWRETQAVAAGQPTDGDSTARITDHLNELFRKPGFHSAPAFAAVDLDAERKELEAIGASRLDADQMDVLLLMIERADSLRRLAERPTDPNALEPIELTRLNLLLFRSAYRDLVAPPIKQRVKVEAVPDETGDDSHIVRFTFRKPNSIFLEQTTTFMFYRGVFNIPVHVAVREHPWGTRKLALTDFWNWGALLQRITAEGGSDTPTPGRRLWERLDEPTRRRIREGLPARAPGRSDEQYAAALEQHQQQVIDGLNEVMQRPGYYDPAVWPNLDPTARRAELIREKGFAESMRDMAKQDEYRDLLIVEDLMGRLRSDGPGSLSGGEHLLLNVAAFRAAFSDNSDRPPVARTREAGLNLVSQNHPRKYPTWVIKMRDRDNYHPQYNPHQPILQAWRVVTEKDKLEILAVRNPYYYRVDAQGNQLPYIDAIRNSITAQKGVRDLKLRSGNVDFQSREIGFDDFTMLKQNEQAGGYEVRLWANDYCGEVTFWFLQAHKDPAIAALHEDPNFRHALSLALNRQEMIDVVFMGMGEPGQYAVPKGSPYHSELQYNMSVEYDPDRANRMLDAMGLEQRASDGTRLLPDGRPLILDLNITQDLPLQPAQLAIKYWQDVGINVQLKIRAGRMIGRMTELGIFDIGMHKEGGNFFGPLLPGTYYPSNPAECGWWHPWAAYLRNGGRSGKPAPERIKELERMWQRLVTAVSEEQKMAAWKALVERSARDLPVMGVMTSPGKVVLVKKNFKNVPRIALAGWIAHEPGNCCPECFYFDRRSEGK